MADAVIPYVGAYGNIPKVLKKITEAAVPPRFTQDFLATKLAMPGGSPKALIPFLKRAGFLNGDGSPTDLYKRFRNANESGAAAAEALKTAYAPLYEVNEYAHDLTDEKLTGLLVQLTGAPKNSSTVRAQFGSFKALREFADFDHSPALADDQAHALITDPDEVGTPSGATHEESRLGDIRLGYTINLNLPPSSDIAVFDAIFKSLKTHLLS
ncbi:MAG: DUF5343 domain-containing protein [Dehalococcoidia bacterium]